MTQIFEKRIIDFIAQINALVSFQVYRETWYHGVRTHFSEVHHGFLVLPNNNNNNFIKIISKDKHAKKQINKQQRQLFDVNPGENVQLASDIFTFKNIIVFRKNKNASFLKMHKKRPTYNREVKNEPVVKKCNQRMSMEFR